MYWLLQRWTNVSIKKYSNILIFVSFFQSPWRLSRRMSRNFNCIECYRGLTCWLITTPSFVKVNFFIIYCLPDFHFIFALHSYPSLCSEACVNSSERYYYSRLEVVDFLLFFGSFKIRNGVFSKNESFSKNKSIAKELLKSLVLR